MKAVPISLSSILACKTRNICTSWGSTKTKQGMGAVMSFLSQCTACEHPVRTPPAQTEPSKPSLSQGKSSTSRAPPPNPAHPHGQGSTSSFAKAAWAPGSAVSSLSKVTVGITLQRQWVTGEDLGSGQVVLAPSEPGWETGWGCSQKRWRGAGVGCRSCESAVVRELLMNSIPKYLLR